MNVAGLKLGFPGEMWVNKPGTDDMYFCKPTPTLAVAAWPLFGTEEVTIVDVPCRGDQDAFRSWEKNKANMVWRADSPIQMLAVIHHIVNTYGGNTI